MDSKKVFIFSRVTESYLLKDMVEHFDIGNGETVTRLANEITLMQSKQLTPEVADRLGLIANKVTPVYGSTGSRYNQSICEKHDNMMSATSELGDKIREAKEFEETLKTEDE